MKVAENTALLGPLLDRVRLPIVFFLVLFATVQHVVMLNAPAQWRLSTMLVAYAVVMPALGWLALRWLARFAQRVEQIQGERLEAVSALRRRSQQIEGLYSASCLLADGYAVEPLLTSLGELALRVAGAEGAGIHWQPELDRPAEIVLSGTIDRDAIEMGHSERFEESGIRYVPLSCEGHRLGWIGLNGAAWDAATRHSLELLAQEVGNLWRVRQSESRTWAALSTMDWTAEGVDDFRDSATSFLTAVADATAAAGASYYCRDREGWQRPIGVGPQAQTPKRPGEANIWRDEAQKAIYVASDADNVLALVFRHLPSSLPRARERQLLHVLACQAGWLLQATDASTRMLARERSRIAAELHDGLSQTLAYLHLQVGHALAMLNEGRQAPASSALEELTEVALAAYQSVRRAVDDLHLQPGPWETPTAYLKRTTRSSAARHKLAMAFKAAGTDFDLPPHALGALASTIQEAIANAACHGDAQHVEVSVQPKDGGLSVRISDDGSGFEPGESRPGHHGLLFMRERIEALGGQLEIDSGPGSGTVVSLFVPTADEVVEDVRR